jgi:putative endonuclease
MSPSPKRKIGDIGEEIACRYLKTKGFKVLERNYWKPWGEIDVVAEKSNSLSFIEVKSVSHEMLTNSRDATVQPEENMHPEKLKRLHRAVQTYLLDHKIPEEKEWRIDLACVFIDFQSKKAKVEMLENII